MKIRFVVNTGVFTKGQVIDPDPPVAQLYVGRGVAEHVREPEIQTAARGSAPHTTSLGEANVKRK